MALRLRARNNTGAYIYIDTFYGTGVYATLCVAMVLGVAAAAFVVATLLILPIPGGE